MKRRKEINQLKGKTVRRVGEMSERREKREITNSPHATCVESFISEVHVH